MTNLKPTYTHKGVEYTQLVLWKAKTIENTFFLPAFIADQIYEFAKDENITLTSVVEATEDEASAYNEGFHQGIDVAQKEAENAKSKTVLG
jgi:hypothetical protein